MENRELVSCPLQRVFPTNLSRERSFAMLWPKKSNALNGLNTLYEYVLRQPKASSLDAVATDTARLL